MNINLKITYNNGEVNEYTHHKKNLVGRDINTDDVFGINMLLYYFENHRELFKDYKKIELIKDEKTENKVS